MAEAGWYYVEGDPPGTVRRWNGDAWIGFPIPDPSGSAEATGIHGASSSSRLRFNPTAQVLSIFTVLSLSILAAIFAFTTLRVWQGAQAITTTGRFRSGQVDQLGDYIQDLGILSLALLVGVLISAASFIPWIRSAAATAEIYRLSGSGAKRRPPSLVVNLIVFVLFPGPFIAYQILKLAVSGVTQGHNRRGGMLSVVSDTATAASTDPRTGLAGISPVKIMIWWAFWWLPVIAGTLSWTIVYVQSPISDTFLRTIVQLNAILLGLEVISLLCIIATVTQISARLWR